MKQCIKLMLTNIFLFCLVGCSSQEIDKVSEKTNVNATLYSIHEQKKVLKKMPYVYDLAFSNSKKDSGTYIVPGLITTETLKLDKQGNSQISQTMDPQGVTTTEEYVLISAYSYVEEYNSVIYVLNKKTHCYIKTIVLDGNPHVGGIIYDPDNQNIWICNDEKNTSSARISSISLSNLKKYQFNKSYKPIKYDQTIDLSDLNRASFIGYKEHAIYVGDFSDKKNGKMNRYTVNEQGRINNYSDRKITINHELNQSYNIGKKIQGVTFYKNNILFSQSFGPNNSKILVYTDNKDLFSLEKDAVKEIEMPPYLEQIYSDKNGLFVIFESATKRFRHNKNIIKVDRLLQLDIPELLN